MERRPRPELLGALEGKGWVDCRGSHENNKEHALWLCRGFFISQAYNLHARVMAWGELISANITP